MKKFLEGVMKWKTSVCQLYTGAMVIYLFFCQVFGSREVSLTMLWSLLLVCGLGALLQGLCYSDWVFKRMRYAWRGLLFCLLYLPVLAVAGWKAQWFPVDNLGSWAVFVGVFFAVFLVMTLGFDIYFRLTGRKYDGLLGQYRKEIGDQ